MGESPRCGGALREAPVAVVRAWRPMIAIVVQGDEWTDGLRIGDALGHASMIPAAARRSPRGGDPSRRGRATPRRLALVTTVPRPRRAAGADASWRSVLVTSGPGAGFLADAAVGVTNERLGPTRPVRRGRRSREGQESLANGAPATRKRGNRAAAGVPAAVEAPSPARILVSDAVAGISVGIRGAAPIVPPPGAGRGRAAGGPSRRGQARAWGERGTSCDAPPGRPAPRVAGAAGAAGADTHDERPLTPRGRRGFLRA